MKVKGRHDSDQFTKLLFESGYKFSVPLDANVSAEVVVTKKFNTTRNFPCTVLQSPVVLTTLNAILVSTSVSSRMDRLAGLVVKASASRAEDPGFESRLR